MTLTPDGRIDLVVGSSSIGQGIETIFAQIAADALEITMDRIEVRHGSTTLLKDGFGSYGSRATVMGGCAVIDAANNLLAQFRAAAAKRLGVATETLKIAEGVARAGDGRTVTLADCAGDGLAADGVFHNSKPTFTYGTGIAHVAVDAGTGHVEVIDYTVVDDVGRIINPETLHGQVMGAAVQGMGSVFIEHLAYDSDGQLLVGSLADYLLPLATDYPHIHCISTELPPLAEQSAGRQGRRRGRHHSDRRCGRQRRRRCAVVDARRAQHAAADAGNGVAIGQSLLLPPCRGGGNQRIHGACRLTGTDYDILVIGGGNAGVAAAITARRKGASVLVLESAPKHLRGGNSRHTRNFRCMHTKPMGTMVEAYPEEEYWDDLLRVTGGQTNEQLARMVIRRSEDTYGWMQEQGVRFQPALGGTLQLARTAAFYLGGGRALINAYYATAANSASTCSTTPRSSTSTSPTAASTPRPICCMAHHAR